MSVSQGLRHPWITEKNAEVPLSAGELAMLVNFVCLACLCSCWAVRLVTEACREVCCCLFVPAVASTAAAPLLLHNTDGRVSVAPASVAPH